jgi:stearoyl-CoA desaturase (Delta-9 desaturase)
MNTVALPAPKKKPLGLSAAFWAVHAIALVGPFFVGISWKLAGLALALYYARMAAITIGYHRYFSHRTFKTGRVFQFLLALASQTSSQKGALWWAAHHRDHHKYSDTEQDVHSPKLGFWWSHAGWILSERFDAYDPNRIKDLYKYPELRWLDRWHVVPVVALAIATFVFGGWAGLVWGFFVSTVMLWHGTFFINSLAHVWGGRRYATTDTSRNNFFLALLTMGEGWHNNHHYYQSSANQGFFWWEVDASYYLIRLFQAVGLVWDVRVPPEKIRANTIEAAQKTQPAVKLEQARAA